MFVKVYSDPKKKLKTIAVELANGKWHVEEEYRPQHIKANLSDTKPASFTKVEEMDTECDCTWEILGRVGENTIKGKWCMDGAATLNEAAEKLRAYADDLDQMKEDGYELDGGIGDDWGFARIAMKMYDESEEPVTRLKVAKKKMPVKKKPAAKKKPTAKAAPKKKIKKPAGKKAV